MISADHEERNWLDKAQRLQDGLVALSTGSQFDGSDGVYQRLRRELLQNADTREKVPEFIRRYRDLGQFWQFIKVKFNHYAERREFLWDSFRPLIDHLEALDRAPAIGPIREALESFDPNNIPAVWQKALDRRLSDPEGAITIARTLLESVCKHVLDDLGIEYANDGDITKLWSQTAQALNLAPHQHQEKLFKTILGNAQSIVNSLGSLRNKIGDAHGSGRRPVKPKPRHAELAVNLAGTIAAFLVATLNERSES